MHGLNMKFKKLNDLSAHYMGLQYIGIHHTHVYLLKYVTLFTQATGHIAVNGFEKCCQVF